MDSKTVSSFAVTSTLSSGKSRFNLLSLSGSAFPKMPDRHAGQARLADAICRDAGRGLSTGRCSLLLSMQHGNTVRLPLESKAGHLRMVSTDGHRLSRIDRVGRLKLAQPLCIPRDGIVELRKLCSAKVRNVDLAVSGTTLYFRASGSRRLRPTLILSTAQFPPYEQVIPRDSGAVSRSKWPRSPPQ